MLTLLNAERSEVTCPVYKLKRWHMTVREKQTLRKCPRFSRIESERKSKIERPEMGPRLKPGVGWELELRS
ncbi:hypothetical protein EVAR_14478_1 [Eumeta japonica]|uniref:Uncharacterized protein n=1 Tax=Eumeta variegata TaxID=151549 RepID=A0A4C1U2Z6_EUMVA|nr:hypothetical protein EVAR_14478_1 [Eumeta japonica]